MKLNNKGFAISTIMYLILVLALILIALTLAILSNRKLILDKLKDEVLDNIYLSTSECVGEDCDENDDDSSNKDECTDGSCDDGGDSSGDDTGNEEENCQYIYVCESEQTDVEKDCGTIKAFYAEVYPPEEAGQDMDGILSAEKYPTEYSQVYANGGLEDYWLIGGTYQKIELYPETIEYVLECNDGGSSEDNEYWECDAKLTCKYGANVKCDDGEIEEKEVCN